MIEDRLAQRVSQSEGSLMIQLQREAEATGLPITWLLRGEPDFDTPPHIMEAGIAAIRDGYSHYTGAEGVLPLREAIADRLAATSGLRVDPKSDVMVTTGATTGVYVALMALLDPGDEVLVPEPYYGPYVKMAELAGGVLVGTPMARQGERLGLDVEALAARVTPRTKAVLINSPMNPSGSVFTTDELTRLGQLAVERNLVILSDECYDSIVFDGRPFVSVATLAPEFQARTIVINSFSKTYAMTGWRLGFTAAPKALTLGMYRVYSQSARCAAAFTQQAGIAALRGPQDVVAAMTAEYERRRGIVMAGLRAIDLPCASPEGAFYAFANCEKYGLSSMELARHVVRVGQVALTPGRYFGPAGDTYLRMSFAASEEDIRRGLEGLGRALAELPVSAGQPAAAR